MSDKDKADRIAIATTLGYKVAWVVPDKREQSRLIKAFPHLKKLIIIPTELQTGGLDGVILMERLTKKQHENIKELNHE